MKKKDINCIKNRFITLIFFTIYSQYGLTKVMKKDLSSIQGPKICRQEDPQFLYLGLLISSVQTISIK